MFSKREKNIQIFFFPRRTNTGTVTSMMSTTIIIIIIDELHYFIDSIYVYAKEQWVSQKAVTENEAGWKWQT